ncbi:hypothetical protein PDIG_06530 [Penicillium digitatum PHI26]|uniref:Uncharacterized protein n=2 Tax=Penicillium digitatum TaxID=36651 RepID=K9GAF1_PEND2|nr:hypothetical protein PDIP_11170 [Penicillium digitatum Pd1]EKV18880.1 hypothetical protein PDIG_06530 [Penicillium digitatum PHI26]EKV20889.1 hypothetical protein PDIP_11170 [Penicillium digitatum Pd1]
MDSDTSQNGESKTTFQNKEHTHNGLTTVPTSVTLSSEQFERLYLTPMTVRQSPLAKKVGNPTPFLGRLRDYHHPPVMLLDGLERSQWKWCGVDVSDGTNCDESLI